MSNMKKLLDIMNETTVSGSIAVGPAVGLGTQRRVQEEDSDDGTKAPDAPKAKEFGLWKNSVLAGAEQRDKKKSKKVSESKSEDRNEMDTPAVQSALKKMAARHGDEKWSKEQLANLGKRLSSVKPKSKNVNELEYGAGQRQLNLAEENISEEQLLAKEFARKLEMFMKGLDHELGKKSSDREILPKTEPSTGAMRENNKRLGPDENDPYEKGWRAGFRHTESNPYPTGSKEAAEWDNGYAEAESQPNHYDESVEEGKTGPGLWANIHAKRERIKKGSGESMRKPGSDGAPKSSDFKDAQSKNESSNYSDSMTDAEWEREYQREKLEKELARKEIEKNHKSQFKTKDEAIQYSNDKLKTFKDSKTGMSVYAMPDGGFDVSSTARTAATEKRRKLISDAGGKHLGTLGPRFTKHKMAEQDVAEGAQYNSQYKSKELAIEYAKEKVKSFRDPEDGIEIWSMPDGGFDVVHTMNSNGRNHCMKNGGKKLGTVGKRYKGVAEGAEETLQQQKIRAAISNGLAKSSQMGKTEYQSQPTNRTYFDNAGYASDKLTGIDSIDPDGTVVISMGDTKAANWVKKLATLGGMPGVKTREVQPQKSGVAEVTGDQPFDSMMKKVTKAPTAKERNAERIRQKTERQEDSRKRSADVFGTSPADKLSIRKSGMAEGSTGWMLRQDPALAKKVKDQTQGYKDLKKLAGKPVPKKDEKGVAEAVHPDITSKKYFIDPTKNVRMGDFEFNARTFSGGLGDPNARGLQIRAYDPKRSKGKNLIGSADFIVKSDKKGNSWLESDDTEVDELYRGKGVAAMMYAFTKSLGNDIKDSPYKSNAGANMWKKWGSDAKHLVGEQGVAEGPETGIGSKLPKSDIETFGLQKGRPYKINPPQDFKPGDRKRDVQQLIPTQDKKDHIRSRLGKHTAPVLPESGVTEGSNKECQPATQDIRLNLKNRQKAIDEYGYGPMNPSMPNNKFWMKKVDEWNLDSVKEAQQSLCGNCAAFDQRADTLDCISKGIGSDQGSNDPTIEAGDLGYCRFLKFKCASLRTCDAWVGGGPLTDEQDVAEGTDDIRSARIGDEIIFKNPNYRGVIVKLGTDGEFSFKNESDGKRYRGNVIMIDRNLSQENRYKEKSDTQNKRFDDAMANDMERIDKSGALKKFGIGMTEQTTIKNMRRNNVKR
jgi:hypothetical protein